MQQKRQAQSAPPQQEPPIKLRQIPPELIQNCTNAKPEKYKFNNSNITEIQKYIQNKPPYDAEKMKTILNSIEELQKAAQTISKSEYGNIPLTITIPPPPKPSSVNNFIKINSSLVELANKICKFDHNQSYKGSLQIRSKPADKKSYTSSKDKIKKKTPKGSGASKSGGNTSHIKPPAGGNPNAAEPENYDFKEVTANATVGPQKNVIVKLQNQSTVQIPPNPPIPNPAKGECPFASMFNSELQHTLLKGLKCPVPSQFKSNLESYLAPSVINVSKFAKETKEKKAKKK
ncbi:hypothetical protein TVAG_319410 [Trichomonas vaginalis G3]|uniref:Uncharacterized protein n=1 Tax=Trichomonas vaginalis (strain ATCC PRA-98 / G3) TaxID=412133 RepID=A2DQ89_TRIV3|nr:hypothetical protein TVAGG3_1009200 [Trichomonas vaginalis G3]EAY17346.1 hypothetical protein TVAG_319410 [Trichomonas vaginalis G3]KAI5491354.1 hypothetical protein TVAGG3_1009200 [Trichomonas vaginalis G3]|eukprot:XP_001330715.1 hypothetical protein [Trichomonas vaginalis G3]